MKNIPRKWKGFIMNWFELTAVAIVLSLDASALALADAMAYRGGNIKKLLFLPFLFGIFQGIMPLAGYYIMNLTGIRLGVFSKLLVFLILSFIGLRLVFSFFSPQAGNVCAGGDLPCAALFLQAICTSIDAFAVGVGLSVIGNAIFVPSLVIAAVTTAVCFAFLFFGRYLGAAFGAKASLVAGIVIVAVGINTLF